MKTELEALVGMLVKTNIDFSKETTFPEGKGKKITTVKFKDLKFTFDENSNLISGH